tara:strand:- start:167 stop:292 length:126 start_codon:yes stop_codon:yes gene_type:complete
MCSWKTVLPADIPVTVDNSHHYAIVLINRGKTSDYTEEGWT